VQISLVMPVSNRDANHHSLPHIGVIAGVYIINAFPERRRHAIIVSGDTTAAQHYPELRTMARNRIGAWRAAFALALVLCSAAAIAAWQLTSTRPAPSRTLAGWIDANPGRAPSGTALFAFGDLGAVDLDTLETSAVPWAVLAAAMAMKEAGRADLVTPAHIEMAFRKVGFLFPTTVVGQPDLKPSRDAPFGLSIGAVERAFPPLRVTTMNIGCAACHAGPAFRHDGTPDPDQVVLGQPNSGLDLQAFTFTAYAALKSAIADDASLWRAVERLFPEMSLREKLTLRWIALPRARQRLATLQATIDRPLPFPNGAPGLTNGVAALKHQLKLFGGTELHGETGFVSIPDLGDRFFRSALLADGAYAPKGVARFRPINKAEAVATKPQVFAAIASFFMVPSMGMSDVRAEAAIPQLTEVMGFLKTYRPPGFPSTVDMVAAAEGSKIYARACAACHGSYDDNITAPRLALFPNWAGDVGTDMSRAKAFDPALAVRVNNTIHGQRHMEAASTGRLAAPLLTGIWASGPYLSNGSVPTLRHLLEPDTRPAKFMTGGHTLDLDKVGIGEIMESNSTRHGTAVVIDTSMPGFSNRGHADQVSGLTAPERDALLAFLKLL
jgi:Cytochrome C oxidase, cbb3-type, subunit III